MAQEKLSQEEIKKLQEAYKLTEEEYQKAFQDAWNQMLHPDPKDLNGMSIFGGAKITAMPVENPVGHIVCGQNGAGKSTARSHLIKTNPQLVNSLILEIDEIIIKTHPDYKDLDKQYKDQAYDILYPFYGRMSKELLKKALNERYNVFLESTIANAEAPKSMLAQLKEAGYKTGMVFVATDKEKSWQSCVDRAIKTGRVVEKEYHDGRVAKYPVNAELVQQTGLIDNVKIIKREQDNTFNIIYNDTKPFERKILDDILNESENKRKAMTNNDDISINHKAFITKIDVDRTEENLKTEKTIEEIQKNLNRDNKPTNIITNEQKDDNNEKYGNTHKMKI